VLPGETLDAGNAMPKKTKDQFKAAFGVKATSTNWKAILKAMNKGMLKLDASIQKLKDYQTQDAVARRGVYQTLDGEAAQLRIDFATDNQAGGQDIRDNFLPRLQTQLTAAKQSMLTPNQIAGANGTVVDVFRNDIPGFDAMTEQERTAALQLAADKTTRGLALFDAIRKGHAPAQASAQNCVDLVWALKSTAQGKRGAYEKGALTAPHGQQLRTFLDTCVGEVYPRKSSHLSEQAKEVGVSGQTARGMDFYYDPANPNRMLPSGMNTILYQQVKGTDGRLMLYVKMETESAIGSGSSNHTIDNTAPNARPPRPGDTGALLAHGKNWVVKKTTGGVQSNKELGSAREDVPKAIKKKCNDIVSHWPTKPGKVYIKSAMSGELRLNKFFEALEHQAQQDHLQPTDAVVVEGVQLLQQLTADYDVDSIDWMFGEEVQLIDNDF
jgi:hypothetical protein